MIEVGIRDLKARAGEIVRRVRDRGEVVDITYHGEVVARLVPAGPPARQSPDVKAILTNLDQLAAEISVGLPAGVLALDAIHDVRRDL